MRKAFDDWTVQEEFMGGEPCTVTNGGYTNRALAVSGDTTLCYKWNTCEACPVPQPGEITLEVDMNSYANPFTTVYVSGAFNGWSGDGNPMDDSDGDGIWSLTLPLAAGNQEYKFTLDNWAVQEEFMGGEACTVTNGGYTNRLVVVDGDAAYCYIWNTCVTCETSNDDLVRNDNLFKVQPTLTNTFTRLTFNENIEGTRAIIVHDVMGQVIYRTEVSANISQHDISVNEWTSGLYFISVQTNNITATKKITKF